MKVTDVKKFARTALLEDDDQEFGEYVLALQEVATEELASAVHTPPKIDRWRGGKKRKNDSKNESWTEVAKALTAGGQFKKGRAEKLAKAAVYTRSTLPVRKAKARAVKAAARAAMAERIPVRGERYSQMGNPQTLHHMRQPVARQDVLARPEGHQRLPDSAYRPPKPRKAVIGRGAGPVQGLKLGKTSQKRLTSWS